MQSATTRWCELLHLSERAILLRSLTRQRLGEFIPDGVPERLSTSSKELPTLLVDEEEFKRLHGLERPLFIVAESGQRLGLFVPETDHECAIYETEPRPEVRKAILAAWCEYDSSEQSAAERIEE